MFTQTSEPCSAPPENNTPEQSVYENALLFVITPCLHVQEGGTSINKSKELVQVPVDVIVNCVAVSDTDTDLPTSNSDLVAVDGPTLPTSAVRLKLGPKSAPSDEFNVTNKFILF